VCLQNVNEDASFELRGDAALKCVSCIGRNQLQLIGADWNCLGLINLIHYEWVGDTSCKRLFEGASFSTDRLHNLQEAAR
jgi:hypothetical protein